MNLTEKFYHYHLNLMLPGYSSLNRCCLSPPRGALFASVFGSAELRRARPSMSTLPIFKGEVIQSMVRRPDFGRKRGGRGNFSTLFFVQNRTPGRETGKNREPKVWERTGPCGQNLGISQNANPSRLHYIKNCY